MKHIDIVFENSNAPQFVEVEDDSGNSIKIGEWLTREDGYVVLRIDAFDFLEQTCSQQ